LRKKPKNERVIVETRGGPSITWTVQKKRVLHQKRLQTFSTLISQMETLLAHYDIKVDRLR